jgi:hypothetical protein
MFILDKNQLSLSLFMKLTTNVTSSHTSNQMFLLSLYVLKNNLNFNNLVCQISICRFYNQYYIISTVIHII